MGFVASCTRPQGSECALTACYLRICSHRAPKDSLCSRHYNISTETSLNGDTMRARSSGISMTVPPGVSGPLRLLGLQLSAFFKAPLGPARLRCLSKREQNSSEPIPQRTVPSCCSQAAESHVPHSLEHRAKDGTCWPRLLCPLHALLTTVHPLTLGSRGPSYGALLGHA